MRLPEDEDAARSAEAKDKAEAESLRLDDKHLEACMTPRARYCISLGAMNFKLNFSRSWSHWGFNNCRFFHHWAIEWSLRAIVAQRTGGQAR